AYEGEMLNRVFDQYFKDDLSVSHFKTCKYTYSPDDHFIIDFLPEYNHKVLLATGFSGHGFKFVPVMGEIISDMICDGTTAYPIDFLGLGRF
ncbi:MAG: FAD-dependent oxidoreductase, partial [Ekhidna sp.]|nr:FAD-dependent oxidoreductase [Ekhidna sp.]